MKKSLIAIVCLATLSFADAIVLEPGWNLLGAGNQQIDINATFENKNVPLVWGYRNIQKEWIATSPDGTKSLALADNNYINFESVPNYMGYWVQNNATNSEQITLEFIEENSTTPDPGMVTHNGFIPSDLMSQRFYIVRKPADATQTLKYFSVQYSDTYGERAITNANPLTTFSLDTNTSQIYSIDAYTGMLNVSDTNNAALYKIKLLERTATHFDVNITIFSINKEFNQQVYFNESVAQAANR